MNCDELKNLATLLDDPQTPLSQKKDAAEHLQVCATCREEMKMHERTVAELQNFYRTFDPIPGKKFHFSFPRDEQAPEPGFDFRALIAGFMRPWVTAGAMGVLALLLVLRFAVSSGVGPAVTPGFWYLDTGKIMDLAANQTLSVSAALGTGRELSVIEDADIRLPGKALLRLWPGARIQVFEQGVEFQGKGLFEVTPAGATFLIRTPCALITVVGTKFQLAAVTQGTMIDLMEGKLLVIAGSTTFALDSGSVAIVGRNDAPHIFPAASQSHSFATADVRSLLALPAHVPVSTSKGGSRSIPPRGAPILPTSPATTVATATNPPVPKLFNSPSPSFFPASSAMDAPVATHSAPGPNPTEVLGQWND
jgi:hypothetical protein